MESLAQNLLWLVWEADLDTDHNPPLTAPPAHERLRVPRAVAVAAGAIVLGTSLLGTGLSAPAVAVGQSWGSTVYVATPPGYALNVRWGPSTNNGIYRRVRRGSVLQVSGARRNGWVELVDATWVAGNLVSAAPVGTVPTDPPAVDDRNLATVITPQNFALNIRSGSGREYPVVGQFVNGSRIPLTGRFNVGWAQLTSGNWVDSSYLQYSGPIRNDPAPT
ncbi:SH3 domain-containing protein, partial [Nodosilinea sp. LEGE 07298]|uniref:SH3 domain-containing protein n=1 Tax=Nodosilinea sp. LEGE 07298 TaxID=2777970 RepID=UPI00188079F0